MRKIVLTACAVKLFQECMTSCSWLVPSGSRTA